jgi:hypothetical protein
MFHDEGHLAGVNAIRLSRSHPIVRDAERAEWRSAALRLSSSRAPYDLVAT